MASVAERPDVQTPAYVAWGTVKNFVERLKDSGMPQRIDKTVMTGLAGGTQAQLLSSIRFLQLIDANGNPTDEFEELVAAAKEDSWEEALAKVVGIAYHEIIGGINLKTATLGQIEERFRTVGMTTGSTLDKCVRFFLQAAKEAGVNLSPHLTITRKPRTPRAKGTRTARDNAAEDSGDSNTPDNQPAAGMREFPVYFRGKAHGKIIVPADITPDDCKMFTIALQLVQAYAEQQEPEPDKAE